MVPRSFHNRIRIGVKWLQRFVNRIWYAPLIGTLAALDNLVLVIPTDGILISSTMLTARRWILLGFSVAIGSTIGAIVLVMLVKEHGLPLVLQFYPGLDETGPWLVTQDFFDKYGLLVVFAVMASPLIQQPALILASLSNAPLGQLALVIVAGRLLKFMVYAYIASHAPRLLAKMWGLQEELRDSGVEIKPQKT